MKKHVDQFKPGQSIPHCHLNAELTSNDEMSPPKLFHQVNLVGSKDPFKFITLILDPQRTLPGPNQPSCMFCVIPFIKKFSVYCLCAKGRCIYVRFTFLYGLASKQSHTSLAHYLSSPKVFVVMTICVHWWFCC